MNQTTLLLSATGAGIPEEWGLCIFQQWIPMILGQQRGRGETYKRIHVQSSSCKDGGNFAKGRRMTVHFLNEGLFWAPEETEDPVGEEQLTRKEKQQWCKINKKK